MLIALPGHLLRRDQRRGELGGQRKGECRGQTKNNG